MMMETAGVYSEQQEMNSWMKSGVMLLLVLLTIRAIGVAAARMTFMDGARRELHQNLMRKISNEGDLAENRTSSYPGTSADNHHKIPRTQFSTYVPPGANEGGNEGDDNNN